MLYSLKITNQNMRCYLVFLALLVFSCQKQDIEFIQPEVLSEGAQFDLTQLTFKEDVLQLLSKSLDTINNDYTIRDYSSALYPEIERLNLPTLKGRRDIHINQQRYYFQSLELDNIAQFFGLPANKIELETDINLELQSCWASAKIFNTSVLNNALRKMYLEYGNTVWMEEAKSERGLDEVVYVYTDDNGEKIREVKYEEPDVNYELYLYEYEKNSSENYHQWNFEDRIIQINITEGSESVVDAASGEIENKKYHTVDFVVVSKKEYDLIKQRLIAESSAINFPLAIIKPYYIKEFDFYVNFRKYDITEPPYDEKLFDFSK